MKVKRPRSAYAQEYKTKAVRLYEGGIGLAATARIPIAHFRQGVADRNRPLNASRVHEHIRP